MSIWIMNHNKVYKNDKKHNKWSKKNRMSEYIPKMKNRIIANDIGNKKLMKSHMYVENQYDSIDT